MFRNKEKEKKMPQRNHNSKRRKQGLNDMPYIMITSPKKKNGFKLKEIYLGVWIFLFYDPC